MGDMDLAQFALLAVNAICLLVLLWQMLVRWGRVLRFKQEKLSEPSEPASVIICARNEAENLRNFLPEVLEQQYRPGFEVVVVDDGSTDDTEAVLEELAGRYSHLRRLEVEGRPKHITAKKYALTMGIKHAKNDLLVFTDADCKPASERWLAQMAGQLNGKQMINLGVSPYLPEKGLLNAFIRFETVRTALDYVGAALGKRGYMGVGRNMAYRKSLFLETKGFIRHRHIQGGDDDLFVNENAKKHSTAVTLGTEAITWSVPKKSWSSWYHQKVRHLMVGKLYRAGSRRLLMVFALAQVVYWLTFIVFLSLGYEPYLILGGFVLKTIVQYLIFGIGSKRLGIKYAPWYLPILDFLLSIYYLILGPAAFFTRKITWKK